MEVYLPAGYDADPGRRWPVTYDLDGTKGDSDSFNAWYGELIKNVPSICRRPGRRQRLLERLVQRRRVRPAEVRDLDIEQLIPLIDARFRTTADRAGTGLTGESMGGYGA